MAVDLSGYCCFHPIMVWDYVVNERRQMTSKFIKNGGALGLPRVFALEPIAPLDLEPSHYSLEQRTHQTPYQALRVRHRADRPSPG